MKAILLCLAMVAGLPALAQPDSGAEAERTRIEAERKQVDSRFAAQEVACYKKFAVTDCLNAARAERRERLSDLRRQELTLNDADRKRRAAERVRSLEERNSAQKQEESAQQRAESVTRFRERQADLEQRAAERARKEAEATPKAPRTPKERSVPQPSAKAPKEQRTHDSAQELRRSNERQEEAKERRERVARRLAGAKPEVKPLPVPP